jgi:preprotein translocase subunit YajC
LEPGGLIILIAMFALLWVVFIMPQRKRLQAQRDVISGVEIGDEIVTVGGLIGRVSEAGDEELRLEIAPGTSVRVSRRAVGAILTPGNEGRRAPDSTPVEDEHS